MAKVETTSVIVEVAGFYGGTWFDKSRKPVDMPSAVAKPFLAPYGDQLSRPENKAMPAQQQAKTDKPAA